MEEDIKILEEYIEWIKKEGIEVCGMEKELQALENLLTRYKQQKERIRCLELKIVNQKDQIKLLRNHRLRKYVMSEYIEKSKVKEKIKELENNIEDYTFYKLCSKDVRRTVITYLQELLREE